MYLNLTVREMGSYDVVIVGGGPSGIAAALSASALHASVLIIERAGTVGGNLTLGHVAPLMGDYGKNTMADRINLLLKPGRSPELVHDFEDAKQKLMLLLAQSGVTVWLNSALSAVQCENGLIEKLVFSTQNGLCAVSGKIYIDATGDGVLSYLAGEEVAVGREDGLCQPTSIMFTICGIREGKQIICKHEEMDTPLPCGIGYLQLCRDAQKSGELPENVNIVRLYDSVIADEQMVNATQANGYNTLDLNGYTAAAVDLRQQMEKIVAFLRNHIEGYENIRIKDSSDVVGVRESRRVMGHYLLTAEDLIAGKKFPDVVVHNANFPIDIHNPSGAGQSENDGLPQTALPYDIPYRVFLPKHTKNLLVTGRCISGTHRAHASYRVMNICLNMGEAVGIAAALSAADNIFPADLSAEKIQQILTDSGIDLFG